MSPEAQGKQAADRFRRAHNLGWQPLGDLVALIEQATSHEVAVLDVEDADQHGLTVWDPKRKVAFIGVARTSHPMRQRSTLAHELSHVLFEDWSGDRGELSARTPEEKRADAFARHLLLPQRGIVQVLGEQREKLDESDLSLIVQRYLVSPAMAAIALYKGGFISDSTKEAWMKITTPRLATRFGWSDQYAMLQHDANQTRVPQRLLARTIAGYQEGVVGAQTIAVLRGISESAVIRELDDVGIIPRSADATWMDAEDLPDVSMDIAILDEALGLESWNSEEGHVD